MDRHLPFKWTQAVFLILRRRFFLAIIWPTVLAALLLFVSTATLAESRNNVLVLSSGSSTAYQVIVASLRNHTAHIKGISLKTRFLDKSPLEKSDLKEIDIIVVVGTQAAKMLAEHSSNAKKLFILITKPAFQLFSRDPSATAVYLEQPQERRLRLAKIALPTLRRVGALLGKNSQGLLPELKRASKKIGVELIYEVVANEKQLIPKLANILDRSEIVISVPDSALYNRYTVQPILLKTYRARIPLLGFSNAYVRAGALLAVYSTPAQIGRQSAEIISHFADRNNGELPAPQSPKYFTVSVNRKVAESLRIDIPNTKYLIRELVNSEEKSQ